MKSLEALEPLEWVKQVNCRWIVHNDLNQSAAAWLDYLATLDDGRLLRSCGIARDMCQIRGPLDDPKPWFYAGLFHLATAAEARRFLAHHRVTRACVPSMADDDEVLLWLDRINAETRRLLSRLREAFTRLNV
jgi:hypothetical protein